ncbi:hypothetical protein [Lysinibacillus sp. 3P01SB]|uniref:hypothetical protein n=1 Tax=Lysinibacillus sp. 3P01SB TaxID=3132284 RepID=UPI0039A49056
MARRKHFLEGQKFNYFTVLELSEKKGRGGKKMWRCECVCGNIRFILTPDLIDQSKYKSCGCMKNQLLKEANTTHGMTGTRIHDIWCAMRARCNNKNHSAWEHYGGRGIRICDDWVSFEAFYEWAMANGYSDELTIDRIDSDGNYEPSNCRWIPQAENSKLASVKRHTNEKAKKK